MFSTPEKRWRQGAERWAKPARALFQPARYAVDVISTDQARRFITTHHYSRTMPAVRLCVGLFLDAGVHGAQLVGAAAFSVPAQAAVVPRYTGLGQAEGVELGRFVCLDEEVPYNGESWFLSRALDLVQRHKSVRSIVSYSDPMERRDAGGLLTKGAHVGQIYQATNALHCGRTSPRWVWLTRAGQVVSERALSKIRAGDVGRDYAAAQLVAAGADPRRPGECPRAWLSRVLQAPTFRRVRHPGQIVYVIPLDKAAKAAALSANPDPAPYPKLSQLRQAPVWYQPSLFTPERSL
ncbi:hypothetical protein [Nitrospirillum amazonense]|uniref:Mom family adenine methylcarbamoylation protein n=1 Tax=Nitrospirillum amazonense TaxID=28077 RepID=UPI0024129B69|nr:hypothetical protein [Nitrospirillum amazonense]MDG3443713.1 hypothetical protein [Nitrospirillum amazonense]